MHAVEQHLSRGSGPSVCITKVDLAELVARVLVKMWRSNRSLSRLQNDDYDGLVCNLAETIGENLVCLVDVA